MKIISLEAENVKHLKAIQIEPDGSTVIIGGDNAAGKSCVLDSIEYACRGGRSIPAKPIRKGQKKAKIVLDLGDIQITRTFTKNGTNLTVKSKDGKTFASPQAMLDKLVGELAFDPLEFAKVTDEKRDNILKQLFGLDFDKLDVKYKGFSDQRTIVNRRGKELKANVDAMTHYEDVLDEEVSIKGLGEKYAEAIEHNGTIRRAKDILLTEESELKELTKKVAQLTKNIRGRQKALGETKEIDAEIIQGQISDADNINRKIRENQKYATVLSQLSELRKQSGSLSQQMATIAETKTQALADAKFPIDGLAIDEDDGVTFEGIPFSQCSSSQQIRISVAMGLAMNPKLRVLLIREGSLLDEKNLAMVAKMAAAADAQIWIEKVSKGPECFVIIEDGSILEPEPEVSHA